MGRGEFAARSDMRRLTRTGVSLAASSSTVRHAAAALHRRGPRRLPRPALRSSPLRRAPRPRECAPRGSGLDAHLQALLAAFEAFDRGLSRHETSMVTCVPVCSSRTRGVVECSCFQTARSTKAAALPLD
eukprot:scaffold603_cov404-Prasinococcus_capsulatus_cf.AAC.60